MKIQNVKLSSIHPYERNPRFNEEAVDSVAKSISEFGFLNPIVIDSSNVIVCGHTRYRAAKKLGLDTVPTICADDLTPEQIKAFRIVDNKTSEIATWNYDSLVVEIKDLQEQNFDVNLLGFQTDVLQELLHQDENDSIFDGETDPDQLPELTGKTASKDGDIYELGEHRLLCLNRIDNSMMSTLLFDGNAKAYLSRIREWTNDVGTILRNGSRCLSSGGCFYIMLPDSEILNVRMACGGCELEVHETLLWLKSNFHMGNCYQIQNDTILYGWKPGASHKWYSDRKQTNLLQYNNAPTGEAPVSMSVYLIRNSTERGEIVLDNFSRNGNTMIACEQTGRRCRMIVDVPDCADLIRKRWSEFVNGEGCDWEKLTPKINRKVEK